MLTSAAVHAVAQGYMHAGGHALHGSMAQHEQGPLQNLQCAAQPEALGQAQGAALHSAQHARA